MNNTTETKSVFQKVVEELSDDDLLALIKAAADECKVRANKEIIKKQN